MMILTFHRMSVIKKRWSAVRQASLTSSACGPFDARLKPFHLAIPPSNPRPIAIIRAESFGIAISIRSVLLLSRHRSLVHPHAAFNQISQLLLLIRSAEDNHVLI